MNELTLVNFDLFLPGSEDPGLHARGGRVFKPGDKKRLAADSAFVEPGVPGVPGVPEDSSWKPTVPLQRPNRS